MFCTKKAFYYFILNLLVKLPRYVRVNTLLTSIDETLSAFAEDGWKLLPRRDSYTSHLKTISNLGYDDFIQDFHIPEVLIFPPGTKFHDHPGYLNGKLLLQDKASCLPAFLLNPKQNSEILDMCSAPGMKTTHLAAIINNKGKIYAVEMKDNRYQSLCDFVVHANASCVKTIKADALTISREDYPNIEYILVDPSCSGSGMVDRIEIRKEDQTNLYNRLGKLQSLQSMILNHALLNFPNVKRVVYSTCSIYPEENESVVDEAMTKFGNMYTLVDIRKKLKNEWLSFGSSEYSYYGDKCLYALPHVDHCSGFFLALFEKKPYLSESNEVQKAIINHESLQQLCENQHQDDEISSVQFNKPKKEKKRKIDDIELDDLPNTYYASEVGDVKTEEITEDLSKKKTKKTKKKLDLEKMEYSLPENQLQHETLEAGEPRKKRKQKEKQDNLEEITDDKFGNNLEEKKINSQKIKDQQFQQEVTVESEKNLEIEVYELEKRIKKKNKTDVEKIDHIHQSQPEIMVIKEIETKKKKKKRDLEEIKDLPYEYQLTNSTIIETEKKLEQEEVQIKKKKKKEKKINFEKIEDCSHGHQSQQEVNLKSEEKLNVQESTPKRKKHEKNTNKSILEEIKDELDNNQPPQGKINESDVTESTKKKKNKSKDIDHFIKVDEASIESSVKVENNYSCDNLVEKYKKKKKKDKSNVETVEQ